MLRALAIVAGLAGCSVSSDVSRELGARCDSASECDDRCLPPGTAFPGGFCSVSCERDSACPSESHCVGAEGGVCLFDCVDDANCTFLGDGWRCRELALREDPAQRGKVCAGS